MTKTEAAYLAGIIDGEGTICISKRMPKSISGERSWMHIGYMGVTNTDKRLLQWAKSVTGTGYVYKASRKIGNQRNHFLWRTHTSQTESVLRKVYPYLLIKKDQAREYFRFRATFRKQYCRSGTPEAVLMTREACLVNLKKMHRREFV